MVNLDNISYIEDSHGKKAVILSMKSFEKIRIQLEELEDIKSYVIAKNKNKNKNEETLPLEIVEKLLTGDESKIKTMRNYRGYSLTGLANQTGITESYLSQIENGKRKGGIDIHKKLARILDIDLDLIT